MKQIQIGGKNYPLLDDTLPIILAAGDQSRWEQDHDLGVSHKQLIDIAGEKLIDRIVRQCRDRGREPLIITHHQAIVEAVDASYCPVVSRRWTCDTLLHSPWGWRTIVLLGDTLYSRTVMDRIFAAPEIYGLVFTREVYIQIIEALTAAIRHAEKGGPGKLRKFYQAYCGINLETNKMESEVLDWVCNVSDYTTDFDTPDDYHNFITHRLEWLDDT